MRIDDEQIIVASHTMLPTDVDGSRMYKTFADKSHLKNDAESYIE